MPSAVSLVLIVVAFAIFPIVWTFLVSLKPEEDIVTATMSYLPRRVTFENYVAIWTRSNFPTLIVNSAIVTTATTVTLCTVVGTLASYAVARFHFAGRRETMMFYLVVRMFPAVMIIIPLFIIMRGRGAARQPASGWRWPTPPSCCRCSSG